MTRARRTSRPPPASPRPPPAKARLDRIEAQLIQLAEAMDRLTSEIGLAPPSVDDAPRDPTVARFLMVVAVRALLVGAKHPLELPEREVRVLDAVDGLRSELARDVLASPDALGDALALAGTRRTPLLLAEAATPDRLLQRNVLEVLNHGPGDPKRRSQRIRDLFEAGE